MAFWKPDPTFYPSPRSAAAGPAETLAYVATFDPDRAKPDALAVLDTAPASPSYGQRVGWLEMPFVGDELHHFGWNACSSALCPYAPPPAHRAALPRPARDALVADLRGRHQT